MRGSVSARGSVRGEPSLSAIGNALHLLQSRSGGPGRQGLVEPGLSACFAHDMTPITSAFVLVVVLDLECKRQTDCTIDRSTTTTTTIRQNDLAPSRSRPEGSITSTRTSTIEDRMTPFSPVICFHPNRAEVSNRGRRKRDRKTRTITDQGRGFSRWHAATSSIVIVLVVVARSLIVAGGKRDGKMRTITSTSTIGEAKPPH